MSLHNQSPSRRLTLGVAVSGAGGSPLAWKWPGTKWNRWADFEHYKQVAEIARSGIVDVIFTPDHQILSKQVGPAHAFDPNILFAAIAAAVPDIGFVLTASSSYNSPYNLARRAASLDNISGGRVILNIVSTFNPEIAANFGVQPLEREDRYRRADEFISVVKDLWLSWDAPVGEVPAERWNDETARPIDHHGEFFDVRGPLNVPIGPQGHPVISQAGASPRGIELAAKHAEIVYAALLNKDAALAFGAELEAQSVGFGRAPDSIRLFPGLNVTLGDTQEEAFRRQEAFAGVGSEEELAQQFLAEKRNWHPALPEHVDIDKPLNPDWFLWDPDQARPVGFSKGLHEYIDAERPTTRQIIRTVGPAGGHRSVVGTPRQVADHIIDWWSSGAVAGFNVHTPLLPGDLELFVKQVVPILQAEGVYPREYDGATIRERFGLPLPDGLASTAGSVTAGSLSG